MFGAEYFIKARVLSDSALVREQAPDGHTLVLHRQFRHKLPNRIIQGDATFFDQLHGQCGGNWLREGSQPVTAFLRVWDVLFQISEPHGD